MKLRNKRIVAAYIFLAFPLAYFILVRLIPIFDTMMMGLTDRGLQAGKVQFVGLENFRTLLADAVFIKTISNTIRYAVIGIPLVLVIGLFIALHLNVITRGKGFFRLVYVLPYITPAVAVSWVWRWMFQPVPTGIINNALVRLGIPAQAFLTHPSSALYCIIAVKVWVDMGFCTTVFLAGLESIPSDIVEAAKIDGAASLTLLLKITLPLLFPIILFLVMREGISFLRIFTLVYNMTFQASGGPLDSTKSAVMYIYQIAFTQFKMGLAASASIILFFMIIPIILLQIRFFDRKISY